MLFKRLFTNSILFCEQNKNKLSNYEGPEGKVLSNEGAVFYAEKSYGDFEIFYGNAQNQIAKKTVFNSTDCIIVMAFQLYGDVTIQNKEGEEIVNLKCNQHNLVYQSKNTLTINAIGCPDLCMFEVAFKPEFIKEMLPDSPIFNLFLDNVMCDQSASITNDYAIITLQMQQVINDIIHTNRTGPLKNLLIQSKVLELLLLQIEYFDMDGTMRLQTIHQSHTEKIIKAKNIIEENTFTPCSLIDLAHMVGTNECTLKKGFKELTGSTVFVYWNDLKMKNAYDLIASSDIAIYEVADQLGYKHAHHFTAAFKKKFNITPAELRAESQEKVMT